MSQGKKSEDCGLSVSAKLTVVKENHCLQTDVLLPLKLQLTKPRGGCQQHVENLHDALHTLSLLPAETQTETEGETENIGKKKSERGDDINKREKQQRDCEKRRKTK